MSEPQPPTPAPAPTPAPTPKKKNTYTFTLLLILLLVAVAGGVYAYVRYANPPPPPVDEAKALRTYIENLARNQKLAEGYLDANGDLVADPPADGKFLSVSDIGFTVVGTEDPEKAKTQWKPLMDKLQDAVGNKHNVVYLADIASVEDQVRAVREGRLHVTAFNTGQIPTAVNTAGFVPLFCIADDAGNYSYRMEILVRPDSAAKSPADLKGKTIGLTSLSSNSGGKAPLVLLKEKFGMLPGRDYHIGYVGDHVRAVKELAAGKHDAVCVASDQKARAFGIGVAKPEQVKVIYESEAFPPLCFGVPHNLPPDLRAKVEKTFADFSFAGNTVGELYKAQGKTRFARVDYAKDWKLIREVDDALTRLLD